MVGRSRLEQREKAGAVAAADRLAWGGAQGEGRGVAGEQARDPGHPMTGHPSSPCRRPRHRGWGDRGVAGAGSVVGREEWGGGLPRASREQGQCRMVEIDGRRGVSGEEAAAGSERGGGSGGARVAATSGRARKQRGGR
jgi:hypothetical protein